MLLIKDKQEIAATARSFKDFAIRHMIVILFLLLVVVISLSSPYFLTVSNLLNIIRQISIIAVLALGMTFVIITSGIDLSIGSLLTVGGIVAALLIKKGQADVWIAEAAGILSGGLLGSVSGVFIAIFRVPPFVMTLAMMTIARGIAYILTDGRSIINLGARFLVIGQGNIGFVPTLIVILGVMATISWFLLNHTKFGRYVYAIGGNEEAALVSGVKIRLVKIGTYMFMGLLSGLAGIMLASRIDSAQPIAGVGYELDAIAAVVIGGTKLSGGVGTILGTLIGALLMGVISNGLNLLNVSPYYQMIARGAIIVLAVVIDMMTSRRR
jgi:ribose/xylose/arabinose/galactoside ABC-type transport system permease subunit